MKKYEIITPGMLFIVSDETREKALVQLHTHIPGLMILQIKETY